MKVQQKIGIQVAHRIGLGQNRPIVVRLEDFADKAVIFLKTKTLKDQTNEDNTKFFVNDQLPEEISERKRQIKLLMQDNYGRKSELSKMDMAVKKGVLHVDGHPYKAEIFPPRLADMLHANPKYVQAADNIKLHPSSTISERGSDFSAYVTEATMIQQVKKVYFKIRKLHGTVTHIACAYRLASGIGTYSQGLADDGEHGAARLIFNYMKRHGYVDQAMFIVRRYGGIKLGAYQFRVMEKVIKEAQEVMINASFDQEYPPQQIGKQNQGGSQESIQ